MVGISKKGVSAVLSIAGQPDLAPPPRDPKPEAAAPEVTEVPKAPQRRRYAEPEPAEEWDDPEELKNFDFDPDAPLVRRRKRKPVEYPTLRIDTKTAKIMRQVWLANRRIDPALSFTEFATVCVQHGLRALKEQRDRDG